MNLKDCSIAIYDYGLFVSLAERLVEDFGQVGYFVPWETSFADGRELIVGKGLQGVKRILYWDDVVDDYDLLCFPDVHNADLQEYYRRQGKRVWGAGRAAEIELLRWKTKEQNKRLGIPVNECYKIHGTAALRQFFQDKPRPEAWYVKVSGLRGLGETWSAHDYSEAKGMIDELDSLHCPTCYIMDFIVELGIPDCKEIGYDGYWVNAEFPQSSLWGVENKDRCYFGCVTDYEELPEGIRQVNDGLIEMARGEQFAQFLSTEIREKDGRPYPIDYTVRHASPAGECIIANMANIAEVIWYGAEGQLVQPIWRRDYAAQIILCAEWAQDRALVLNFDEALRPWIKIYNHARVESGPLGTLDYFVPQIAKMKQVGSVVALGDDPEEAVKLCKERAQGVKGFDLESECDALDKTVKEVLDLAPA